MKDLFGKAILDYQTNNYPEDIITETSISEEDSMSVAYLFRGYKEMPKLEQKALELAKGKVLDVGCGAGSHALYLQNERRLDVMGIDISPNAIEACNLRGLKKTLNTDLLNLEGQKFETILLLMNGTGIFGRLNHISKYLQKLKSLLNPGGQILIDSSDIIYMFDDDEDVLQSVPCTFLDSENYCLIYDVRPKACREFPHTDRKKFQQIANLTMKNVAICPAAYNIVEEMKKRIV